METVHLSPRVTPPQKNRVLQALRKRGHVVGYLGDGINDAPALHSADVGISVEGAVDVARGRGPHPARPGPRGRAPRRARGAAHVRQHPQVHPHGQSQLRQHVSMAGGTFLPFLPMLPIQVLLTNLIYDVAQMGLPIDLVDREAVARPIHWDIRMIERFMLVLVRSAPCST